LAAASQDSFENQNENMFPGLEFSKQNAEITANRGKGLSAFSNYVCVDRDEI
jgi:hypothetical protein